MGEAEIIRLIFRLYIQGITSIGIEKILSEDGYVRREGKEITQSVIEKSLRKRIYIGEYSYNIIAGDNPESIVIPNSVPAIIDKDTFDKAQLILDKRSRKNTNNISCVEHGLLYKKVYCGYSGQLMQCQIAKLNTEFDTTISFYRINKKRKNTKYVKPVSKRELEDFVSIMINRVFLNKRYYASIKGYMNQYIENTKNYLEKQLNQVKQLYYSKKEEATLIINKIACSPKDESSLLLEKLNLIQREVEDYESLIVINEMRVDNISKLVSNKINNNIINLKKQFDISRRTVINKIVDRVIIYDEYIRIMFRISPFIKDSILNEDYYKDYIIYSDFTRDSIKDIMRKILYKEIEFKDLGFRRYVYENK